jgi:hypothetical protein
LVHIIRPGFTVNATTGAPSDETYSVIALNVPCYIQPTDNIDIVVGGAGRLKNPGSATMDTVHMAADVDVQDADILKYVSQYSDGSNTPDYGTYVRVQGAPSHIPSAGNRSANKLSVRTLSLEKTPLGLPV